MPRHALVVNLDFQDFVYSHMWGQAMVEALVREGAAVDVITVSPSVDRDIAAELGVPRAQLAMRGAELVRYVDRPEPALWKAAIADVVDRTPRPRYDKIVANVDAATFLHLFLDREAQLGAARWVLYDRRLHVDLRAHEHDARLRERIERTQARLYMIREIAGREDTDSTCGLIGFFRRIGFDGNHIALPKWPLDEDFFSPRPAERRGERFVLFSGGDSGRDYATLFEAIRDLPVELRLCANDYPRPAPPNVTVLPRMMLHRFRDEVARADALVLPLSGHPPVSGITVVAMAKMVGTPVLASDTPAVRMHVPAMGDGGYLVQIGNATLMRALVQLLIDMPEERERLSREGREQAVRELGLRAFATRLAQTV